jgi:GTP cyclohydrolase I
MEFNLPQTKAAISGESMPARKISNRSASASKKARSAAVASPRRTPAQKAAARTPGMPDVQAKADPRQIAIDRVGVKEITYPIRLRTRDGGEQTTVAKVNMYVALPHYQKGTHMSRFLEVLNDQTSEPITPDRIPELTRAICQRLNAQVAHFEARFPYFIKKLAPVTGQPGLMDYEVTFECTANGETDFILGVAAPATSLCPCSKEISEYGAHNQRCRIEARVRFEGMMWIEDLVELLEKAASCPVFAVLKRPDEKWVTERAFENPKFVEDIVRDLAMGLDREDRVLWYSINSENFESIHSHNAYAQIIRDKRAE